MKSFRALAASLLLALLASLSVQTEALAQQTLSYQLLTNATASGPVITPLGSDYLLNVAGTFGGTTLTLQEVVNGQTVTLQTLTSAPASPPCIAIPNGATIQMVVTGGSPSGLYANLGGVGSGGCAGTGNASSLAAGSAIIGKVGIDQTTPGTTNGVQVDNTTTSPVVDASQPYPSGATPLTASATGTTAATTATLAGTTGKTTYLCGFAIRANATAAATGNATVTGTITGTLNFTQFTAPLASGIGTVEEHFSKCVPASATNTGIAVVSAAPGSGGTVSVSAYGFQQ